MTCQERRRRYYSELNSSRSLLSAPYEIQYQAGADSKSKMNNTYGKSVYLLKLLIILREMVVSEILRLEACSKFGGEFALKVEGKVLSNSLLVKVQGISYYECLYRCARHKKCRSINFSEINRDCELNSRISSESNGLLLARHGWNFYEPTPGPVKSLGPNCQQMCPCKHGTCVDICEEPGFACTCDEEYTGSHCDIPLPGVEAQSAGGSCLDIRNRYVTKIPPSGMYWINAPEPVRMYCDMEIDGGGWTKVGNMNVTSNDLQFSPTMIRDDLKTLNLTESPYYALSTTGLAQLRNLINFTSIRIYCSKHTVNRTIHLVTASNSSGLAVVDYMTGKSSTQPASCGSYVTLPDDNSILSASCAKWYTTVWSFYQTSQNNRLYDHPAFIIAQNHIITGQYDNRFECDDYSLTEKIGIWKFFVR